MKVSSVLVCSQLNGTPTSDLKKEVAAPKAETLKEEQIDGSESKREGAVDGEAKKSEDRGHEDEEDNEGDSSGDEDDDDEGPVSVSSVYTDPWTPLLLFHFPKTLSIREPRHGIALHQYESRRTSSSLSEGFIS